MSEAVRVTLLLSPPTPPHPLSLWLSPCQDIVDFTSISTSGDYMRFPAARDVACQTDAPKSRAVGTQLSAKTLRPFLGRKGLCPSVHLLQDHLLHCSARSAVQCGAALLCVQSQLSCRGLLIIKCLFWDTPLISRPCLAAVSHNQTTGRPKAQTETREPTFESAFQRPRNHDGPREDAELNRQTQSWLSVSGFCCDSAYLRKCMRKYDNRCVLLCIWQCMLLIKEDLLCRKKKSLWTQHHVQKLRWQIYVPEGPHCTTEVARQLTKSRPVGPGSIRGRF